MTTAGPLAGVTVVSLEQAVAAPFATRQLADLGARVIKVERPGVGDFARGYDRAVHGESSYFVWLNRGKESIELDLKDPADRDLVGAMVAEADVVVQNLLPGAAARLGLDAATLRARRPELIHCSISGYGPEGPYSRRKAYDLLVQCESGALAVTGTPEEPVKVGFSVADIATGMYAFSGILTALLVRAGGGDGSTLEVAMLDAMADWMSQPALLHAYGERTTRRTGARHASIAPYGPYRCGGGETVFLAVQNDREWSVLCRETLARPDLVDDSRFRTNSDRVAHDDDITALIEKAFADRSAGEVVAHLDEVGIAAAQVREPADLLSHPQLVAADRWREVATPGGAALAVLPPVRMGGVEVRLGAVPALGADNEALRREFQPAAVEHEIQRGSR